MTQSAIFASDHPHTYHLEYKRRPGATADTIRGAVRRALDLRSQGSGTVLGLGSALWSELAPESCPAALRPFDELKGTGGHSAPSTQGDLFLWIHGDRIDDVFTQARRVHGALIDCFELAEETPGFEQAESRDLIGFIDGSANPEGDDQKTAALIPDGEPCAGGSFIMTQKWVHDLAKFNALEVLEQERIVGRTKQESIELEGDAMPPDSHVSRTDIKVDGVAQKILRHSTPFGTVDEHGLYFLAFACDPGRFDIQLQRMYGMTEDGLHDRIIEFSRAVSGAYWYAPSEDELTRVFS